MLRSLSAVALPAAAALAGLTVLTAVPAAATASARDVPAASALVSDPAALVNPMIGTGSGGATVGQVDTFPGATAPFGMLTFSPDTPSRPDGGGYNYADSSVMGFSLTHVSGPGCGADGDFPILPTTGSVGADPADSTEPFEHSPESASPGRYDVTLDPGTADAIQSDLAATTRTGIGTFTYPRNSAANMLFKIGDAQSGNTAADIQIRGDDEVTGDETAGQFCGSPGTYPVHFVAKFSRPFASYGTWQTEPTGPNVFTQPTGDLDWAYHEVSSGGSAYTITPTTTSSGASAVAWVQATAEANTWIQAANPPALTQGDEYLATVTVQGQGDVFLDFYNGTTDVDSQPVNLSSTPTTLTVATTIPAGSIGQPVLQVRTASTGPVNLVASNLELQQESVVETTGSASTATHGTAVKPVPAAANGKAAGSVLTAPAGTEAKGGQSRTQVATATGLGSGAWVTFGTAQQADVTMKVAISYVSQQDAGQNLQAEDPGWSTAAVAARTQAEWNGYLGRIRIGGGTAAQQAEFYTALYHALLDPNVFSDVNGKYIGFDNEVHQLPKGQVQYANYSGWDVYRDEIPLLAVVAPQETGDMMSSLLNDQAQGGWLPKWGFANDYTDVMNGDAADPILAEAYAFGVRNFNAQAALAAMVKGATVVPTTAQLGQGWYDERPDLANYQSLGYVPNTQESSLSPVDNGASETLEYSIADFAISQLAQDLGDKSTASTFLRRSQNWTNIFNTATGYIEPRDGSGQFPELGPDTYGWSSFGQSGFQEGNAAQYTWEVPQDIGGLISAIGGDATVVTRLDTFFSQLNAGPNAPYEWAGNEPSLATPWLYDYAGAPTQTQQVVHDLLTQAYSDSPGGEPGNDDLGALSSWYVWSSLGIYPATPGTPVLTLGAPIFSRAELDIPGRPRVTINAAGASPASYIQGVTVNGRPTQDTWLSGAIFGTDGAPAAGPGTRIGFSLTGSQGSSWGTAAADAPPSYQAGALTFPPGRTPETLVTTGPNLLGTAPTGQLSWQGPVANGVGSIPGTITPDLTTPQGASAVEWTETDAPANSWIWLNPTANLTGGQEYQASVTLQGTGDVYLDFYNGQEDLTSETVQLTSAPVTLTLDGEVPSDYSTPLQVRTASAGPVDLYASNSSIYLLTAEPAS
ncbi:MAG TPA: GH92 family glycosyl hydrolase [Trebonia sp.]|jgi:putative alpha-1,2-mannosidase|nr:GH92 family glycosyl hydrolase [Trebonia sp.]